MTIDFKNFFSFEKFKEIAEIELKEKNNKNPNYDIIFEKEKLFSESILNYLQGRASQGLLSIPLHSETHYSHFLTAWENLLNGKLGEHEQEMITYSFNKLFSNNMIPLLYGKEEVSIEENYKKLIDKINDGNFNLFDLDCDSTCFGCGEKMHFLSKDWNFAFAQVKYDENRKAEVNPLPKCIEEKLYEVKVEFKTGELLIADWFRIPEFTKQVEYDPNYKKVSINYDLGRVHSTQHAAQLGFITVHVGNSCPTIFQHGENFMFGHLQEDSKQPSKYKNKGNVCTDLWNVTIIDKSRLIEIVTQTLGEEKAIQTVEKYLKEEKNNITFINVQPGEYTIGFNPKKEVNHFDKDMPQDIETLFSMKKNLPKKKMKP